MSFASFDQPAEPVSVGGAYTVITSHDAPLPPPPGASLIDLGLDDSGQWRGWSLRLADEHTSELSDWCMRYLRRVLTDPRPVLRMVFPPEAKSLADESLVTPPGMEVILAIEAWGRSLPGLVLIWDRVQRQASTLFLETEFPVFLSLGRLKAGSSYEVIAPEARELYLSVHVAATAPLEPPEALRLIARGERDGVRVSTPLFSPRAMGVLQEVRLGTSQLEALEFPSPLPVTLATRKASEPGWREADLGRNVPPTSFWDEATEALRRALGKPEDAFRFDAGDFGCVEILEPKGGGSRAIAHTLPPALIRRLRWLLGFTQVTGLGAETIQAPPSTSLPFATTREANLVERFIRVPRWPAALIPHVRATAKDLRRHLCGG